MAGKHLPERVQRALTWFPQYHWVAVIGSLFLCWCVLLAVLDEGRVSKLLVGATVVAALALQLEVLRIRCIW